MTDDSHGLQSIIDELRVALGKGGKLAVALEFAGKVEEARQVAAKVGDLRAELNRLLIDGPGGRSGAGPVVAELQAANERLQGDIIAIKKKRDLADAIANALGRLDAMIADAKGYPARV